MNPWLASLLGLALGFGLGSIPASHLAGRWFKGIDLRDHGSGNLGATNAFRVLGPVAAIPVLIVDVGKGALAVWLAFALLPAVEQAADLVALLAAVGAVLGHSFSPFVGWRGGKGVATAAGAFGTLAPWAMLPAFLVWLLLLLTTRIMSVASVAAATVLPVNLLTAELLTRGEGEPFRVATLAVAFLTAAWVVLRHRSNLSRLRRGEEKVLW
jgi:glycerol-3-phosphate acyltransferase PlsY